MALARSRRLSFRLDRRPYAIQAVASLGSKARRVTRVQKDSRSGSWPARFQRISPPVFSRAKALSVHDCVIVGGGVIGLSLAYELAGQGLSVHLLERGQPGQEASWAGAGMLPPSPYREHDEPIAQLAGLSCRLHPKWAKELLGSTGIDNGYRRCGAWYVYRGGQSQAWVAETSAGLNDRGVAFESVDADALARLEPTLVAARGERQAAVDAAILLPDEAQIRNPRHLKALAAACRVRGVKITSGAEVRDVRRRGNKIEAVVTEKQSISGGQFCIAAGSWSGVLLDRWGLSIPVKPIRGQMVLLGGHRTILSRIVNEGPRYLVPRDDGRLLVGSTEEDAGFEKTTTEAAIAELIELARTLAPELGDLPIERTWAGLRPASVDGLPLIGRLPSADNAFVATGHYRSGLHLSPATAVTLSALIRGEKPAVDLAAFDPSRF